MQVIDVISADEIEVGDLINIKYDGALQDTVKVDSVTDDGVVIRVHGESMAEGDGVVWFLLPRSTVELLGA